MHKDPRAKYRDSQVIAWTRIDMLLLIYESAIETLDKGVYLLESGHHSTLMQTRFDAQRRVLLIADGLNIDKDETAVHIMNICVFILDQIQTDSVENWRTCVKLLETLHEGFQAIAEDVRDLERRGKIPQLTR